MRLLLLCSLPLISAVAMSCNGTDGASCSDYETPSGFDAQNPKVTFAKDVAPLFNRSCAFVACHGSTVNPNGVALPKDDFPAMYAGIVDVRSSKLTTMSFVKKGEPKDSYLMRKIDGSHCALNAQCVGGTCGERMPKDDDALPIDERNTIRRWIAQGANND